MDNMLADDLERIKTEALEAISAADSAALEAARIALLGNESDLKGEAAQALALAKATKASADGTGIELREERLIGDLVQAAMDPRVRHAMS